MILALDPGTSQTGFVLFSGVRVIESGVYDNDVALAHLVHSNSWRLAASHLAIERIASYGMAVGREVFETCEWVGRFRQAWKAPEDVHLVYRKDVKMHLCGSTRAKDPNVRAAILDLFPRTGGGATPQIGTKHCPGPLHGVSTHAWPALGVAIVVAHQLGTLKVQTEGPLFEAQRPREVAFP